MAAELLEPGRRFGVSRYFKPVNFGLILWSMSILTSETFNQSTMTVTWSVAMPFKMPLWRGKITIGGFLDIGDMLLQHQPICFREVAYS